MASDSVLRRGDFIAPVLHEIHRVIVGQDYLVNRLLMGMLCNGHLLVEGVPGLAKSLAVKTLADTVDADFKRIQFTPDLLPADLNGTMIYNPSTQSFSPRLGPIFTDLLLADEINRAPPKVQSALLEARAAVRQVHMDDAIKDYVVRVVFATRDPQGPKLADLKPLIAYGVSPRATIYVSLAARAHAFLDGRDYVLPDDIKAVALDVMRHRLIVTYEAEAEEITPEMVIGRVLDNVAVP